MIHFLHKYFIVLFLIILSQSITAQPLEQSIENLFEMNIEKFVDLIVYSSTKKEKKLNEAPNIVTVFTASDIKKMGFNKLTDIFWTLPGVQVHQALNNRERVWFRGAQTQFNNKTSLLINGVKQQDYFGGYPSDLEIPLRNVKRVEIVRGPGSALYGGNALAGVISIFTYEPGELNGGGKVELVAGNVNTQAVNILSDYQTDYGNWLLDANVTDMDGQQPELGRNGEVISKSAQQSANNINISASFFDNDLITHLGYRTFNNLHVRKGDNRPSQRDYSTVQLDGRYNMDFSTTDSSLLINASYYETERDELETRYNADGSLNKQERFIDKTRFINLGAMLSHPLSEENDFTIGVELSKDKLIKSDVFEIRPGQATVQSSFVHIAEFSNIELNNNAVYLQDSQSFFDKSVVLTLGVRKDFQERFGDQTSTRFGLVTQLTKQIFVKILYGTAFRSPSFLEFTRAPDDPSIALISQVEKMTTVELQLGYLEDKNLYTLTFFNNQYRDYIDKKEECFNGDTSGITGCGGFAEIFGNTGNREMTGIELELKSSLLHNLNFFFNASYLITKDSRTNAKVELLSDWTVSTGIYWFTNIAKNQLSINTYLYTYGDRNDWNPSLVIRREQFPGQRQNSLSNGFIVLNGKINYDIQTGDYNGLNIELAIYNMLNEKYYNQDVIRHNARFDSQGQEQSFKSFYDSQYDERMVLATLGYRW